MKIALINASPKFKESASEVFVKLLENNLCKDNEISLFDFKKPTVTSGEKEKLEACEKLVFVFPLYVDGIPGHLLYCLREMEKMNLSKKTVYAVVNCGFYEGEQNRFAFEILENWCNKIGFSFNCGVGVGGGGCIVTISNMGSEKGPMKPLFSAMEKLSDVIKADKKADNFYLSVGLPRFFYKFAAQISWRQSIKKNGGKIKDLANRPEEG